jgi:ion channel-forming bestrophin family protein
MIDYDPHRWWHHFFDIRGSMVKEITGRVLSTVIWSAAVVWIHTHLEAVALPSVIHSLIGFALGLLLVFRTNSSYDRFWEGRRQWGNIVNASRNLARAARPHLASNPALYAELVQWAIAFSYTTMNHLRGRKHLGPAASLLPPSEAARVCESVHPPLACASEMSQVLSDGRRAGCYGEYTQMILDGYIQQLMEAVGACERIHRTPLPFAYMVHLRRALVLYCLTLPFAIVETFRWHTVPAILMVAYTFFGIEEIGVEIEDPFGEDANDLPLERFCDAIRDALSPMVELKR